MKESRQMTPIACAHDASATVSRPMPAIAHPPADLARSPGRETAMTEPPVGYGRGVGVKTSVQHQPEQQAERRKDDRSTGEHRDHDEHQRVVGRRRLGDRQARKDDGRLGYRPPGDDRDYGNGGDLAGGQRRISDRYPTGIRDGL
jgi:hypothetical protein